MSETVKISNFYVVELIPTRLRVVQTDLLRIVGVENKMCKLVVPLTPIENEEVDVETLQFKQQLGTKQKSKRNKRSLSVLI